jgi:hypothetical protein
MSAREWEICVSTWKYEIRVPTEDSDLVDNDVEKNTVAREK